MYPQDVFRLSGLRPGCIISCPANATFQDFCRTLDIALSDHHQYCFFEIFDREQTNCPINLLGLPSKVVTEEKTFNDQFGPTRLDAYEDILHTTLFHILGNHADNHSQKVIHYCHKSLSLSSNRNFRQYVILLMEREVSTWQFKILWSAAARCIED